MEKNATLWLDNILFLGWVCTAIFLTILVFYAIRLGGFRKRTEKYKFATANETSYLNNASNMLAFGIGFFSFYLILRWVGRAETYHLFGVGFFAIIIAFAFGYAFWAILKYYYPFILEKRLNKIRFKPMRSTETGNEMRLLTEDEEDVHLTEAMIEEEEAFSADYDVWMDDKTGEKVIEKYDTHYHALLCGECNFRTLKDIREEIIKEPTIDEEGLLRKDYKCSYCGHKQTKEFKIASWSEEQEMSTIKEAAE